MCRGSNGRLFSDENIPQGACDEEALVWLQKHFRVRQAVDKDISTVENLIAEWLNSNIDRQESVARAIERKELLVAE
jgi:hypothetical protein